jgi:membrane protein implicated in regulation of membrane protease activity
VAIVLSLLLSLIYGFWLHLWYLVAIVLSVLLSFIFGFWLHPWYSRNRKSKKEGQTTQWPQDTKEVTRNRMSKKEGQTTE